MWTIFPQATSECVVGSALEGVGKKGEQEGLLHSAAVTPKKTFCTVSLNGSMATYRSRSAPVFLSVWFSFFFSPSDFTLCWVLVLEFLHLLFVCRAITMLLDASDFKSLCCH